MSTIGITEHETQERIIALFRDELGYRILGDHSIRAGNSNIEEELLAGHPMKAGYAMEQKLGSQDKIDAWLAGADREERHGRRHQEPSRWNQGQQRRGGGNHLQQCPRQDHQ